MTRLFPPFDLHRLLTTVFDPQPDEGFAIMIDLDDPRDVKDFRFLNNPALSIQRYAHDLFYKGLQNCPFVAYRTTGGSNLDLPDIAFTPDGHEISLARNFYPDLDIVLCISTYSATAPLTALAKHYGFRGATMHGLNQVILETGLSVDYNDVSREAERLRQLMTRADRFEIQFEVAGKKLALTIECGRQEAQKSHGLCRGKTPDIANLPAGEVYFVPTDAQGEFPMKYEDGTVAIANVASGRVTEMQFISGNADTVKAHNAVLKEDPATGLIGELGLGTQDLPPSGRDIQDEKIMGTVHVATGRNDHLGGDLTPKSFTKRIHATHDDILFAPWKTPEIKVPHVTMWRDGNSQVVIENYSPTPYLQTGQSLEN
jgi:hypothetical protein